MRKRARYAKSHMWDDQLGTKATSQMHEVKHINQQLKGHKLHSLPENVVRRPGTWTLVRELVRRPGTWTLVRERGVYARQCKRTNEACMQDNAKIELRTSHLLTE